ncbi:hypothetical protein SXCC_01506 [Gluconacetobacter sp. SXCC-1]|nr:hypothetical protein SXCC_01506 [Gluconacetobacter sp. SXCC-1]
MLTMVNRSRNDRRTHDSNGERMERHTECRRMSVDVDMAGSLPAWAVGWRTVGMA